MRITAKVDYAVRAALELARAHPEPLKGDQIATDQAVPWAFTERILGQLRRAGIVTSRRGGEGGYRLARAPSSVSVADIIRAVEGPLADVRGIPPESLDYPPAAAALQRTWIATRASLRAVLETVTLAHLAGGELPAELEALATPGEAWERRSTTER